MSEAPLLQTAAPDDGEGRDFALIPIVGPSYWRGPLARFHLWGGGDGPLPDAHKENSRCSPTS